MPKNIKNYLVGKDKNDIFARTNMTKMYIIIDKNNRCWHSKMYAPIARAVGVSRITVKRWFENPRTALKKGYQIYISTEAKNYKSRK